MTIAAPKHVVEVISSSSDLAIGALLQVTGTTHLSVGAALLLRFTFGPQRSGRVIAIEDAGTRAVIEVNGKCWRLHRRGNIVNAGPEPFLSWIVDHDPE